MNHPLEISEATPRAIEKALRAATQTATADPDTRLVVRIAGAEFNIEPGQIFAVAGLSRRGKSALMRRLTAFMDNGLIFMDEPFSELEQPTRARMREVLRGLHDDMATTIVFATDDVEEALALGDQVVIMRGTSISDEADD